MTQVVVIHGGDTFDSYEKYLQFLKDYQVGSLDYFTRVSWKRNLPERLGGEFQVIAPRMPNINNCKYLEWKIWFEKLVPFLSDGVIFVGHSMGGIFLAKYLSEEHFPRVIKATFLVTAPFDVCTDGSGLADFILPEDLGRFEKQGGTIYVYHSTDDPAVPFSNAEQYLQRLPKAELVVFSDRGHFTGPELPELVEAINNLS